MPRPAGVESAARQAQQAASAASLTTQGELANQEAALLASASAIEISRRPMPRPADLSRAVEAAVAAATSVENQKRLELQRKVEKICSHGANVFIVARDQARLDAAIAEHCTHHTVAGVVVGYEVHPNLALEGIAVTNVDPDTILAQVVPLSVLVCHWYANVADVRLLALVGEAVKVAVEPRPVVWLAMVAVGPGRYLR